MVIVTGHLSDLIVCDSDNTTRIMRPTCIAVDCHRALVIVLDLQVNALGVREYIFVHRYDGTCIRMASMDSIASWSNMVLLSTGNLAVAHRRGIDVWHFAVFQLMMCLSRCGIQ